jgi:hypothetical protein
VADQEPLRASAAGTITGTVRDVNGQPKAYANVVVLQTKLGAMTDQFGKFRVKNVSQGTHGLRVSLMGYARVDTTVVVQPHEECVLNFVLQQVDVPIFQPSPRLKMARRREGLWTRLQDISADFRTGQDAFAARLHQELASSGGNVVHSPLSIAAACGLLLRGARGETAREIATCFTPKLTPPTS